MSRTKDEPKPDEVVVHHDGRWMTETDVIGYLRNSGASEESISIVTNMIQLHREFGLLPLDAREVERFDGDSR